MSFIACDKTEILKQEISSEDENLFFLKESEMNLIAGEVKVYSNDITGLKSTSISNKLKEYILVYDEDGLPSFYILNYEECGFIILAADKRSEPILAFSYETSFPLHEKETPRGLQEWKENSIKDIKELRNQEWAEDYIAKRWDKAIKDGVPSILPIPSEDPPNEIGDEVPDDPNDPVCNTQTYSVSPLLSTVWHQSDGFNNDAPYKSCSTQSNGRAKAGCVAIAGAQVMNFLQYPSTYNYNLMYNTYGSSEASRLIRDIGNSVDMKYGCEVSRAYTIDLAGAFKDNFSYSSANYGDFNPSTVRNELNWGYPVILRGESSDSGHAWICDGYDYYVNPCGANLLWLHMNWGWGFYNGYYRVKDFRDYNYNNKMIYGIRK